MTMSPAIWHWVRLFSTATTRRRLVRALALTMTIAGLGLTTSNGAWAAWQGAPARQVVVFGVVATPGSSAMDPKIAPVVQAQLRRLLPNHGFRVLKIKSDRVTTNGAVKCDLSEGFTATARLSNPLDPNGKVQMRFDLSLNEVSQFQTIVATPPDQFNFFDKALGDGNRLLVGVGAR